MGLTLSMQKYLETPLAAQWKFPFVVSPRFCRRRITTLELTDNFWTHAADGNGYAVREVNSDHVLFRVVPVLDGQVSDGRTKWLVDEYGIPVAHLVPREHSGVSSYDVCLGKRRHPEAKVLTTFHIKFIPGRGDPLLAEVDDPHTGCKNRLGCNGMWRQRVAMLYLERGRESQREPIAKVYRPTNHRIKKSDRNNVYHVESAIGVDIAFVLLICAAMDDATAHFHKAEKHPLHDVAAAIDPVDADKVYTRAQELQVPVAMILTTHSHWDHAGGNQNLVDLIQKQEHRSIPVIGGAGNAVEAQTRVVNHNEIVKLGLLNVKVLYTPCHTRDHVLYYCEKSALFTGDTLFVAGCGRFFNGTAAEMHYALNEVVATLPEETKIYCGHEYTMSNLRFAAHVEPENEAVQKKLTWAMEKTKTNEPTIPSTVKEELRTNPFMRVTEAAVQQFANEAKDPIKVMDILRAAKDKFVIGK